MQSLLRCVSEPLPGEKWLSLFERSWSAYHKWFLREGDHARPAFLTCERKLREFMPELVTTYERLMQLAGDSDQVARFLSLYRPTPYMTGCSQAVWKRDEQFLIRNYDYAANLWEATILHTAWNGRKVVAMSDCLWGALDGMNEQGLAVSLAFGGRKVVGDGFGIPLILRYILEFCDTTSEAIAVLQRVPSHMAYNVTVLDKSGHHATVFVAPDRDPVVSRQKLATNHQGSIDWPEHATATASVDRAYFLTHCLNDEKETRGRFVQRFLEPPLYQPKHHLGWGTLYTAVYEPASGLISMNWPGHKLQLSTDRVDDQVLHVIFG